MSEESKEYWAMVRDQMRASIPRKECYEPDSWSDDDFKPSMSALRLRRLDAQERHETGGSVYE